MHARRIGITMLTMMMALPLACCGGGGSTTNSTVQNVTVTKGQQLLDLKSALDSGAISRGEYEVQRQRILDAP